MEKITKSLPVPIFVFSLPRSGSTLLQRILMNSNDIESVPEPWFLLPLLSIRKKELTLSAFNQSHVRVAINEFIDSFPAKIEDYNTLLREYVLKNYQLISGGKKYFLDKTPRYYFIIEEIFDLFPDAKYIFLFRNPLDIYNSLLNHKRNGDYKNLYNMIDNFRIGTKNLAKSYRIMENNSIFVNYNDMVSKSSNVLSALSKYLDVEKHELIQKGNTSKKLEGKFGDRLGQEKYDAISKSSIDNWKQMINSKFDAKIAKEFISMCDPGYLKLLNISKEQVIKEVDNLNSRTRLVLIKRYHYYRSLLVHKYNLNILFRKKYKWIKDIYLS